MSDEIEELTNKLLAVETKQNKLCDKMFNNEREIQ